jgi:hypothetical protein
MAPSAPAAGIAVSRRLTFRTLDDSRAVGRMVESPHMVIRRSTRHASLLLSVALLTCAGQWVGTTIVGGKTYPTSSCVSQSDADAMNGDAKAVGAYLKKTIPPEICKITDVRVDGNQVIYTASCGGRASKVVTTSYHGDSSEGTDSTGGKTEAKRVGACK